MTTLNKINIGKALNISAELENRIITILTMVDVNPLMDQISVSVKCLSKFYSPLMPLSVSVWGVYND